MKICYFDLNCNWTENYSLNPQIFGGGSVFAREAIQLLNDLDFPQNEFWIYASPEAFISNQPWDDKGKCIPITEEQKKIFIKKNYNYFIL